MFSLATTLYHDVVPGSAFVCGGVVWWSLRISFDPWVHGVRSHFGSIHFSSSLLLRSARLGMAAVSEPGEVAMNGCEEAAAELAYHCELVEAAAAAGSSMMRSCGTGLHLR